MIGRVFLAALLAASAGGLETPPALAADAAQSGSDKVVVATVDGVKIYLSDIEDSRDRLPERLRKLPPQAIFGLLVNSLIDSKLAAAEARLRRAQSQCFYFALKSAEGERGREEGEGETEGGREREVDTDIYVFNYI